MCITFTYRLCVCWQWVRRKCVRRHCVFRHCIKHLKIFKTVQYSWNIFEISRSYAQILCLFPIHDIYGKNWQNNKKYVDKIAKKFWVLGWNLPELLNNLQFSRRGRDRKCNLIHPWFYLVITFINISAC